MQVESDTDRVRFAVDFANGPSPMALAEDELEELRAGVQGFLQPGNGDGLAVELDPLSEPQPQSLTEDGLSALHEDVRRLLGDEPCLAATVTNGKEGYPLGVGMSGSEDSRILRIGGSTRACFLLALAFLVSGPSGVPVRSCPECGRLFIRKGRQKYCRRKCTNAANWRSVPEEKKREYRERQTDNG